MIFRMPTLTIRPRRILRCWFPGTWPSGEAWADDLDEIIRIIEAALDTLLSADIRQYSDIIATGPGGRDLIVRLIGRGDTPWKVACISQTTVAWEPLLVVSNIFGVVMKKFLLVFACFLVGCIEVRPIVLEPDAGVLSDAVSVIVRPTDDAATLTNQPDAVNPANDSGPEFACLGFPTGPMRFTRPRDVFCDSMPFIPLTITLEGAHVTSQGRCLLHSGWFRSACYPPNEEPVFYGGEYYPNPDGSYSVYGVPAPIYCPGDALTGSGQECSITVSASREYGLHCVNQLTLGVCDVPLTLEVL